MSEPHQQTADEPPLAMLLRGQLALSLTVGQIRYLIGRHGLASPLGFAEPSGSESPEGESALSELGIIDDGVPSAWFLALWRTVTAPILVVVVERTLGTQSYLWLYGIDQNTFAEQVRTSEGCTWLFGNHDELLPRVLLNVGLLRFAQGFTAGLIDPLAAADAWSTSVDMVGPRRADGSQVMRRASFAFEGESWAIRPDAGPERPSTSNEVAEQVAMVLGATL